MKIDFVKIDSKTQSTKYLPTLPKNWIVELEQHWAQKKWEMWNNLHYDICSKICNDIYSKNEYWKNNKTHADFLNELTKEQRIYSTLINFESQVNNGGVYQFLTNNPELSIIALEAMKETGMSKLAKDYEEVLIEYFGKYRTIQELYSKFQNDNEDWIKRWNSFSEGYEELPSAEKIEDYFYDESFVKTFHRKLIEYVKVNSSKLYNTG